MITVLVAVAVAASLLSGVFAAPAGATTLANDPLRIFAPQPGYGPSSTWTNCPVSVTPSPYCYPDVGQAAISGDGAYVAAALGNKAYLETASVGERGSGSPLIPNVAPYASVVSGADDMGIGADGTDIVAREAISPTDSNSCDLIPAPNPNNDRYCGYGQGHIYVYTRIGSSVSQGTLVDVSSSQWPAWMTTHQGHPRPAGEHPNEDLPLQLPGNPSVAKAPNGHVLVVFQSAATDLAGYGHTPPAGTNVFVKDIANGQVQRVSGSLGGYDPQITRTMHTDNAQDGTGLLDGISWTQRDSSGNETLWVTPVSDAGIVGTAGRVDVLDTKAPPVGNAPCPTDCAATASGLVSSAASSISGDGRFVAFISTATNMGDTTGGPTVYLRDRKLNRTTIVAAKASDGSPSRVAVTSFLDNAQQLQVVVATSGIRDGTTGSDNVLAVFKLHGDPAVMSPNSLTHYQALDNVGRFSTSTVDGRAEITMDGYGEVLAFNSGAPPLPGFDDQYLPATFLWGTGPDGLGENNRFGWGGDPTNVATGNFVDNRTDFDGIAGRLGTDVTRTYNSQDPNVGVFGPGWSSVWDQRVTPGPNGSAMYHDASGGNFLFTKSGTGFTSPPGQTGALTRNATTNVYTLTQLTQATTTFNADGTLASFTDGQGQSVTVDKSTASPTTGVMFTASNAGYTLTFKGHTIIDPSTHLPIFDPALRGRVIQVVTPGSAGQADAAIVDYTYALDDVPASEQTALRTLHAVSRPHLGSESTPGTINYKTLRGRITSITESMDTAAGKTRLIVSNNYDAWGRVTSQGDRHGGVTTFQYDTGYTFGATHSNANYHGSPGATTVTNFRTAADAAAPSCGCNPDVTVYWTDGSQSLLKVETADTYNHAGVAMSNTWTNGQRQDTGSLNGTKTRSYYDSQGRLEAIIKPDPNSTSGDGLPTALAADGSNYADPAVGAIYEKFSYTTLNRVSQHRDTTGMITKYEYDSSNTTAQPNRVITPCDVNSLPKTIAACPTGNVFTMNTKYFDSGPLQGLVQQTNDADLVITDYTYVTGSAHTEDNRQPLTVTAHPTPGDASKDVVVRYRYLHPGDSAFPAGAPNGTTRVEQTAKVADFGNAAAEITSSYYDVRGRLLRSDDPLTGSTPLADGVVHNPTLYTYYETGELRTMTDPSQAVTTYGIAYRSEAGNTYPNALDMWNSTSAGANAMEVQRTQDALGKVTEEQFDNYGDKIGTLAPNGTGSTVTTTYTYGKLGRLLSVTTPPINAGGATGVTTTYRYDNEGQLLATVTGPDGVDTAGTHTSTKEYDRVGRLTHEYGPAGQTGYGGTTAQMNTQYKYDTEGRLVAKLEGASAPSNTDKLMTAYQYDAGGRPWRTIVHRRAFFDLNDPYNLTAADSVTETRSSAAGRLLETWQPPADSFAVSACGGWFGYACFDWATATNNHASPDAAVRITTREYDGAGRVKAVTDPLAMKTSTTYDPANRPVTVTSPMNYATTNTYDKAGQLTKITTPSPTGTGNVVVERTYDARGNMISDTDPHTPGATVGKKRFHYDVNGRLDVAADQNAVFGAGYQKDVIPNGWWQDPAANVVGYVYDDRGNRTSRISKNDAGIAIQEDSVYDQSNHLVRQTLPHSGILTPSTPGTTYTYDNYGRITNAASSDQRSITVAYWNPQSGPVQTPEKTTTYAQAGQTSITYKSYVNARGATTRTDRVVSPTVDTLESTNSYDQEGRLAAVTVPQWSPDVTYTYDLTGNIHSVSYPDGRVSYTLHDKDNRLVQSCAMAFGTCWPAGTYGYNNDGVVTSEQLNLFGGNGSRAWTINNAHMVTGFTEQITMPTGSTTQYDTYQSALAYRTDSRLASETLTDNGAVKPAVNYGYDNAGQICIATTTANPACQAITATPESGTQNAYTYGSRGNRLSQTIRHEDPTTHAVTFEKQYYSYTDSAQLCRTSDQSTSTCANHTGNRTEYTYDADGRRTNEQAIDSSGTSTKTINRTFDQRGLPTNTVTSQTGQPTLTETRAYDANRYLTGFGVASGTDNWVYNLAWDRNQSNPTILNGTASNNGSSPAAVTEAVYGLELLGSRTPGGLLSWYKYDAHGSPIASQGNTNAAAAPSAYSPFGTPTVPAGTFPSFVSYKGELNLGSTLYLRARDYDAATGTFTSRDPLDGVPGSQTQTNPYTYSYNDPLDQSDASGMRPTDASELSSVVGSNGNLRLDWGLVMAEVKWSGITTESTAAEVAAAEPPAAGVPFAVGAFLVAYAATGIVLSYFVATQMSAVSGCVMTPDPAAYGMCVNDLQKQQKIDIQKSLDYPKSSFRTNAGGQVGDGCEAHHIVAQGSQNPDAVLSRGILAKSDVGIGVHDPVNSALISARGHAPLHTKLYYRFIYKVLQLAYTTAANGLDPLFGPRLAVLDALRGEKRFLETYYAC